MHSRLNRNARRGVGCSRLNRIARRWVGCSGLQAHRMGSSAMPRRALGPSGQAAPCCCRRWRSCSAAADAAAAAAARCASRRLAAASASRARCSSACAAERIVVRVQGVRDKALPARQGSTSTRQFQVQSRTQSLQPRWQVAGYLNCACVSMQPAQRAISQCCKPAQVRKQSSPLRCVSTAVPVPSISAITSHRTSRCRAAHLGVRRLEAGLHALQCGKAPPAPLLHRQPLACALSDSAWPARCVLCGLKSRRPASTHFPQFIILKSGLKRRTGRRELEGRPGDQKPEKLDACCDDQRNQQQPACATESVVSVAIAQMCKLAATSSCQSQDVPCIRTGALTTHPLHA